MVRIFSQDMRTTFGFIPSLFSFYGFRCLDGTGGGSGLTRGTDATCGGNSLSCIAPLTLPLRRFSICCGSSGRPGCSDMNRRCSANGTTGGGGVLRVIKLGGARSGPFSVFPDWGWVPAFRSGVRAECCAGTGFFVPNGVGRDSWPRAGRVSTSTLLAAVKFWARTGGVLTGFPGRAARTVGFTLGWGITCARASCWGVNRTTWRATACPVLKTWTGTAVVATLR